MKITAQDYKILETHVISAMAVLPTLAEYREKGLSDKRWRWDLLWRSGLKIGDSVGMPGDLNLYDYCNDTHIDTALRKITGTK